jgi:hypothetical protein
MSVAHHRQNPIESIIRMAKSRSMGRACSTNGGEEKCIWDITSNLRYFNNKKVLVTNPRKRQQEL